MRLRLTPRDGALFPLLQAQAEVVPRATALLVSMTGSTVAERSSLIGEMRAVERDAAAARLAVLDRIVASFVTPYDREDLYRLATALDTAVDRVARAADRALATRLPRLPERLVDQVDVLQRCAELVAAGSGDFPRVARLRDVCTQLRGIVAHGARTHEEFVAEVLAGRADAGIDALEVVRHLTVADSLLTAIRGFEDIAQVLETIAVKEA